NSPPISRLGIPAHYIGNEALHGICRPGDFTVFPKSIALAATFDPGLIHEMATAASDEARARHNEHGRDQAVAGYISGLLTFFSPNVNMARDPRWGRTPETYGEDPLLVAAMAEAFVKGLQGTPFDQERNLSTILKAVTAPKHFVANNEEYWYDQGTGITRTRHNSSSDVSEKILREYYFSGFRAAIVDAKAESIMSAYNEVNGVPCCADKWLLTDILRDEWGHVGYVVSDCGDIEGLVNAHHYVSTLPEASAVSIKAGLDIECGEVTYNHIEEAIMNNYLTEAELDRSVRRALLARFRLGTFNPVENDPYATINPNVIGNSTHQALALDIAEKSIVLLKNDNMTVGPLAGNPLLPILNSSINNVTVVGINADKTIFGDYAGTPVIDPISPLEGIQQVAGNKGILVNYVNWDSSPDDTSDELAAAINSDMVIAVLGNTREEEREGFDRMDLSLPDNQVQLIQDLAGVNPNLVVVLNIGSTVTMGGWLGNAPAIVNMWYGGESGGLALANILFGDVNPSGHLPMTFYQSEDQLAPFWDYDITKNRTYMYLQDAPLFPFGHGLSYTNFSYSNLSLNQTTLLTHETLGISVNVSNLGLQDGDDVVQIYVGKINSTDSSRPLLQLEAFKRVSVNAGGDLQVDIPLEMEDLAVWETGIGAWNVEKGTYEVLLGTSAKDIVLSQQFTVI
ncbi:MAG: glycoside hydrolase family 3 C-terminal domain-containing protein, partial [Candidatus Hodarchaeota archaeon]